MAVDTELYAVSKVSNINLFSQNIAIPLQNVNKYCDTERLVYEATGSNQAKFCLYVCDCVNIFLLESLNLGCQTVKHQTTITWKKTFIF